MKATKTKNKAKNKNKNTEDFNVINGYEWNGFKKGFHILKKIDYVNGGEVTIKLSDADFINEGELQYRTINNITR